MNKFTNRLKELRAEKKISQLKFSNEMGVVQQTISKWESGISEPEYDMLIKIAKYFGVSIDYLLGVIDY